MKRSRTCYMTSIDERECKWALATFGGDVYHSCVEEALARGFNVAPVSPKFQSRCVSEIQTLRKDTAARS